MKPIRIALCGASGVGKSTLSERLSHELNVPFVSSSAKKLWNKHNISSHKELIDKTLSDPQWGYDFQVELLDMRAEQFFTQRSFITDRSPIDNIAYMLMQVSHGIPEILVHNYIYKASQLLSECDIIYLSWGEHIKLEDDGMRLNNKEYQAYTDGVMRYVLSHPLVTVIKPSVLELDFWSLDARVLASKSFVYGHTLSTFIHKMAGSWIDKTNK